MTTNEKILLAMNFAMQALALLGQVAEEAKRNHEMTPAEEADYDAKVASKFNEDYWKVRQGADPSTEADAISGGGAA